MSSTADQALDQDIATRFGLPTVGSAQSDFFDPFVMDSAMFMPRTLETFWDYAHHLFYMNNNFRHAWHRLSAYFATGIDFKGDRHGDNDAQKDIKSILLDNTNIMGEIVLGGMEIGCYGNCIFTWGFPFDRVLVDNRNGYAEHSLNALKDLGNVRYHFKEMVYEVVDPKDAHLASGKRKTIKLGFRDRPSRDVKRFRIERLDLREMHLLTSASEFSTQYIRRFSPEFLRKVRDGDPWFVHDVPMDQLLAISKNEDFLYNEDSVLHIKMPTIRGLKNFGWGIPETFANYRSLHHLQVLRRIDEAVGKDYLLPFRMFVPNTNGPVESDTSRGEYAGYMSQVIADHRKNPYAMHAIPFPSTLIEAGGSGKSLVQADSIEFHTNSLLGASGLPAELYNGTMNIQNMPVSLRLFESTWQFLYHGFNKLVAKTADHIQDIKKVSRLECQLTKSSLATDLEERGIYLSLVASGEISRSRGYGSINIEDPFEEKKKRMREDADLAREDQEMQKQMQQEMTAGSIGANAGQPGSSPTSGYGNPPGGGQNITPMDQAQDATQRAQTLLGLDTGSRMKELAKLKATDPNGVYPLVKQKMEELRAQGASQGRASVGQQQQ